MQIKTISGKVCQRITTSADEPGGKTGKNSVDKNVEKSSTKDDENVDWLVNRDVEGDVNHVAIVDQIREAATEVARDQFLKVNIKMRFQKLYTNHSLTLPYASK